jgi:hypothetical protein
MRSLPRHRFCPGCWRDTFEEGEYRALWSSRANDFLPESQQVTPWYGQPA